MLPTMIAALAMIGVSRLVGWDTGSRWWWVWLAAAGASAMVGSVFIAMRNRLSDTQCGGVLDDRLGLKSQIRSAIELDSDQSLSDQSAGFIALAQRHARSAAAGVEIQNAMEPVETKNWWRGGSVFLLVIAAGIWMPMRTNAQQAKPIVIPDQAIASIQSVGETVDDESEDGADENSPEVREAFSELESLKEELARGVEDPSQANAQTAAKLEQLADAIEDEIDREQSESQELSDRIAKSQNQARPDPLEEQAWDQPVDHFADAIKEQEYNKAQESLDELREQLGQMSDEQRDDLAEQLEQLAEAVEPDPLEDETGEQNDRGRLDDLAESIRDEARRVREPDQSEPGAQSPTEPKPEPEPDSGKESDQQSERESSEKVPSEKTPSEQSPPEKDSSNGTESEKGAKEEEPRDSRQSGEEPSDQPTEQPSGQQSDQPSEPKDSGKQQQGESREQSEGSASEPSKGAKPGKEEEVAQQDQQENGDDGEGDESKEITQESEQGEPGAQQGQQTDKDQPEQGSGDQQRQGTEQTGQTPQGDDQSSKENQQQRDGQQSLDEALEEMEKRRERSNRNQDRADEIRREAKKLIDPDQSQEQTEGDSTIVRPDKNQQDQSAGTGDDPRTNNEIAKGDDPDATRNFVPVDASGGDQADNAQPVGKWYAPEGESPEPAGAAKAAQRFREASQQAQQAVEKQQVPRKYRRVVREVFKRVNDRADAIETGGKVAPQGKDATPKPGPDKSGPEPSSKSTGGDE